MTYLDLFSGIGGFALGLELAGICIDRHYFSEIDKYATAVYQKHFPPAKGLGDVRTIKSFSELGTIDLVTFGFPCQDLSTAGKRAGLDGDRSGLFFEAMRIIRETRPTHFIFENVKGLLTSNAGADFERCLQEIANLGIYDCEWQLCNTSWFLPQNRERIYFIGHLSGQSRPKVFPIAGENEKADGIKIFGNIARKDGTFFGDKSRVIDSDGIACCLMGSSDKNQAWILDRKTNLYIVPRGVNPGGWRETENCPTITTSNFEHNNFICRGGLQRNAAEFKNKSPALTAAMGMGGGNTPIIIPENTKKGFAEIQPHCGVDLTQMSSKTRRGRKMEIVSNTLTTQSTQFAWYDGARIRKLTPTECERLQGFPDNWTAGHSDSQRYKMLGNAVSVPVPEYIFRKLYGEQND